MLELNLKSDDRRDPRYRSLGASVIPDPKKIKLDDLYKWKTRTLGDEAFRQNVKTVIMILTSRGQDCCDTLTDLEKEMFRHLCR